MQESPSDAHFLTPLDSIPGYSGSRYAHQVLFFPLPKSDQSSIVRHVKASLDRTIEAIPLIAGTVRHVSHPDQKGRSAITAPWRNADDIVQVQDLSNTDYPSYETLRSNHFPLSAVNYDVLMSFPPIYQDDGPVIMVQINFIKGGMIWGIAFDHAYTDGTGAVFVCQVWGAYCRGEDGSALVTPDVMQRERLMHGSKTGRLEDYPHIYYPPEIEISKPEALEDAVPATSILSRLLNSLRGSAVSWFRTISSMISHTFKMGGARTYSEIDVQAPRPLVDTVAGEVFFFPREKLQQLKKMASTQKGWISTNDALASLLYCCIIDISKTKTTSQTDDHATAMSRAQWIQKKAVLGSLSTKEPFAGLGYATNARKHFTPPLAQDYIGNVTIWNGIIAPLSTITPTPQRVSDFAYHLRHQMQACNPAYMSDLLGVLDSFPDISRLSLSPGPFTEFLVVTNSWAAFKWNDIDWGSVVGGKCERLRFETVKVPGFCLVLPEIGEGARCEGGEGLEVVVTLKQGHLDSLKQHELFMSFAEWRCN